MRLHARIWVRGTLQTASQQPLAEVETAQGSLSALAELETAQRSLSAVAELETVQGSLSALAELKTAQRSLSALAELETAVFYCFLFPITEDCVHDFCLHLWYICKNFYRFWFFQKPVRRLFETASVVKWSDMVAIDPEVSGSIPSATRFSK
jgi:hypothetical protein